MKNISLLKSIVLALFASNVNAAALYLPELGSPQETGFAGAGMTARAQDAGTVFTNPAGMVRIKGDAKLASAGLIYMHLPFDTNGGTTIDGPTKGATGVLPYGTFAYNHSISDKLKIGVSVQNYFGLALDWSDSWVGRYTATSTTIMAPQVQPTVAYKVNDWLSVGAGTALTLGILSADLRVANPEPGLGDGYMKYQDTDFAVQANIGLMIEPSRDTRIGVRYLSETSLNFSDNPSFKKLGPTLEPIAVIDRINLDMNMPQSVIVGVFHQLDKNWAVLGDVGWEEWSRFGYITVSINSSGPTETDLKYDDTWHVGIATQYKPSTEYTYNAGFSYDTALSSDKRRSIAIPLGKMYRFGIGGERQKSKDLAIGVAAEFLWEGKLSISSSSNQGDIDGQYTNVFMLFASVYAKF